MTDYVYKITKKGRSFEAVECDAKEMPKGEPFPAPTGGDKDHPGVYPEIQADLKTVHKVDASLFYDPGRDDFELDPKKDRKVYTFKRPPHAIRVIDPERGMKAEIPPMKRPGKP